MVPLATRCSVHCKSDATHKLNKGECTPGDVARSLIHNLAQRVAEMIASAQWQEASMVVCGGVSRNTLFLEALRDRFPQSSITVLPESPHLAAYGAAVLARSAGGDACRHVAAQVLRDAPSDFETLPPLGDAEPLLDYRVSSAGRHGVESGGRYILGVDAGSTTTKAVLYNTGRARVDASCYLRTLGDPVAAARRCLRELQRQAAGAAIRIVQTGATGSGREIVSVFLENCLSFNEILTHARAAAEESPGVDTVFEIGGQDAKFISFQEGIPVDYAMNEGCSAGTGSFLEESAQVDMDIPTERIAPIAESSAAPLAFGERCAAFIDTDLRNALQQGAAREDVVGGLVYSVADNYISRIAGPRRIGDNVLFMGGVALNRAVALALAARTRHRLVVPPHPELMGAVGSALMALDLLGRHAAAERDLSLERLAAREPVMKEAFRCEVCENRCEIQRIAVGDRVYPFGGLCSLYEGRRHGRKTRSSARDLVALRNRLMCSDFAAVPPPQPSGRIGIPLALTAWELLPFYATLVAELGFEPVFSEACREGNARRLAPICYPCEVMHGAVQHLLREGVRHVFIPRVIEVGGPAAARHGYTCPSTGSIADIIRAAFSDEGASILSPHMALTDALWPTTKQEIVKMGAALGIGDRAAGAAADRARRHYDDFLRSYAREGAAALAEIRDEPAVILAGRPYTVCDPNVNLALPRKILSRGYHVIPADMLPMLDASLRPRDVWHYTQQISNAVRHSRENPCWHVCLVSCFSCGPDAEMYHLFRRELSGQTFCYLEIDSHTAHAGIETRVGAFLDIVELRGREE